MLDEVWNKLPRHLEEPALQEARKVWAAEVAPKFLNRLAARVAKSSGPFLLGPQLCWADAWIVAFAEQISLGVYDHVDQDLLSSYPVLVELVRSFKAHELFLAHGLPR